MNFEFPAPTYQDDSPGDQISNPTDVIPGGGDAAATGVRQAVPLLGPEPREGNGIPGLLTETPLVWD